MTGQDKAASLVSCATCNDSGTVYTRRGDDSWDPEDCPNCPDDLDKFIAERSAADPAFAAALRAAEAGRDYTDSAVPS